MEYVKGILSNNNRVSRFGNMHPIYRIALSPREYTPTEDDELIGDQLPNCKYIIATVNEEPSTAKIKQILIDTQKEYDSSDEVNCFYINGDKVWMDKATRVGLVNSMNVLEVAGQTEYTVWFGGKQYTASIALFKQVLAAVEIYAMQCYAVTEQHLAEIELLNSLEEYLNYPIYEGYPEKLSFNLE